MTSTDIVGYDEPGVPGDLDEDGKPFFFPNNQKRSADLREQREGFIPRWEYGGHTDRVKGICATGVDSLGRMRFVSTDGKSTINWLEFSQDEKIADSTRLINAMTYVSPLNVVAASSGDELLIFDGRTMRLASTLSTSKKVLLQLQYNRARDEIISGSSGGCFVWQLATVPCDQYAVDVVPYELKLLRGFKGCSQWAGNMAWDEATQIIITIDVMKVKTYDAISTTNLHTIPKAHEVPVTVGLWMGESQNIVTGCRGGRLKIWACQHTHSMVVKRGRRRGAKRRARRLGTRRKGNGLSPALVKLFEGHTGPVTGIVRHCLNTSCIVSCGVDGMLRVWDIDRLAPVSNVQLSRAVTSLWTFFGPGDRSRMLWVGKEGRIRTMVASEVCQPLSFDSEEARNLLYSPPLRESAKEVKDISPVVNFDGRIFEGNRVHDPRHDGLVLVQMNHGQWGLIPEGMLPTTSKRSPAGTTPTARATPACQTNRITSEVEDGQGDTAAEDSQRSNKQDEDRESAARDEGYMMASLFYAWPPLSCVVERYRHHALSRKRLKVICLSDSGTLDSYRIGAEKGETHKIDSHKVHLQANGAIATCMCLLPNAPACVLAAFKRLSASHTPQNTTSDDPGAAGDAKDGGDKNHQKNHRIGVLGRARASHLTDKLTDLVVAIGTSHGSVLLVETVFNGTMLEVLEGLFASKVLHLASCVTSTEDAAHGSEAPPRKMHSETWTEEVRRLVCVGYNANGTVTIKGLALSSLIEKFSIHLVEVPTCVRVASRRPILAIGFADGTLNLITFGQDRVHHLENSALVGAHTARVNTISFSTPNHCMATGDASGCIMIWGLDGERLHTIYLQSPVTAVEFMEVSGVLLVSSSSGLSRIPPCRWCPRKLLVAAERANRRATLEANNSNSGRSSSAENIARQDFDTATIVEEKLVPVTVRGGGKGKGGNDFASRRVTLSPVPQEELSNKRLDQAYVNLCSAGKVTGDAGAPTSGAVLSPSGDNVCEHEMRQNVARDRSGDGDEKRGVSSGGAAGSECASPVVDRDGDIPGIPSPLQLKHPVIPNTNVGGKEKKNILDLMSAKVSSIPTSPPPRCLRQMKHSTRGSSSTLPASHHTVKKPPGDPHPLGNNQSGYGGVHQNELFDAAQRWAPTPVEQLTARSEPATGYTQTSAVDGNAVRGDIADKTPTNTGVSKVQRIVSGSLPFDTDSIPSAAATVTHESTCTTMTEVTLRTPEQTSSVLSLVRKNFSDEVPFAPLKHAGGPEYIGREPAVTAPLTRATLMTEKVGNILVLGTSQKWPLLSNNERHGFKIFKPSSAPRGGSRDAHRAKKKTSVVTPTSGISSPRTPSANFVLNHCSVAQPPVGPGSAKLQLGSPFRITDTKLGLYGLTNGNSTADKVKQEPPCFLRDRPNSDMETRGPAPPPHKSYSSEDAQDAPMSIRHYRTTVQPASTTLTFEQRRKQQVGNRAMKMEEEMPPVSVQPLAVDPSLVEDLLDCVSNPPRSPPPSISRTCGRTTGEISPLSWGIDGGDQSMAPTPRLHGAYILPREATISQSVLTASCEDGHIIGCQDASASFLPFRPIAGRPAPGPSRSRAQMVPHTSSIYANELATRKHGAP